MNGNKKFAKFVVRALIGIVIAGIGYVFNSWLLVIVAVAYIIGTAVAAEWNM
jgi:hypothetical protein